MNVDPGICQTSKVHIGMSEVITFRCVTNRTSDFLDQRAKVGKSGRFVAGRASSDEEHQLPSSRGCD